MTAAVTITRRITALTAIAVGALSLFPISTAQAAEPTLSCWYNVDNDTMGCFDTSLDPHEQIERATGTQLVAVPTGAQSRSAATAAASAATYLLATGWDATGRTGASVSYFTTNPAICTGLIHSFPNLGTWSNRFESFEAYNGCEGYLFDGVNYGGTEFGPLTVSNNLGTFSNRAESMSIEG